MGNIFYALLSGLSLSADSFAVSLCSSVNNCHMRRRVSAGIALVFAIVQTCLLLGGWGATRCLGGWMAARLPHFERIANLIGFALLVLVAVLMLREALHDRPEKIDFRHAGRLLLGAVATSIDAFSVGISMALDGAAGLRIGLVSASTFFFTFVAVIVGMCGGRLVGTRYGRPARIAGALLLLVLAFVVLMA